MRRLLHNIGLCPKARYGYRCHGNPGECTWPMTEQEARLNELDRFADWLTDNDPRDYMQYYHGRAAHLDER